MSTFGNNALGLKGKISPRLERALTLKRMSYSTEDFGDMDMEEANDTFREELVAGILSLAGTGIVSDPHALPEPSPEQESAVSGERERLVKTLRADAANFEVVYPHHAAIANRLREAAAALAQPDARGERESREKVVKRIASEMWVGQKEALLNEEVSFSDAVERAERIYAMLNPETRP